MCSVEHSKMNWRHEDDDSVPVRTIKSPSYFLYVSSESSIVLSRFGSNLISWGEGVTWRPRSRRVGSSHSDPIQSTGIDGVTTYSKFTVDKFRLLNPLHHPSLSNNILFKCHYRLSMWSIIIIRVKYLFFWLPVTSFHWTSFSVIIIILGFNPKLRSR